MGAVVCRSSAQRNDVSSGGHNSLYSKNDSATNEPNTRLRSAPITKENHNRILKETHECFVAMEGFQPEGELCDFRWCKKNPGHVGFISMDQFSLDHVPPDYCPELMFEYIKALSAVTVRIKPTYVSHGRPDNYPLDQLRGKTARTFGTGRLFSYGQRITPCPCMDCGGKHGTASYRYDLQTAKHVIYDATEAKHATVDVYFDKAGPTDVTLTGVKEEFWSWDSPELDLSFFSCITHDLETSERLDKDVERFHELCREIDEEVDQGFDPRYLPIVSHPHGFNKHVSFGDLKDLVQMDGISELACFHYTTPTCPGSSGATIKPWRKKGDLYINNVHHAYDNIREENQSDFSIFLIEYEIKDVESTPTTMGRRTNFNQTDLSGFSWYYGDVGRDEAERRVKDLGLEGTFLVRESSHPNGAFPYILVVFLEGNVYNIGIRCHEDSRFSLEKRVFLEKSFESVEDLVEFHREICWTIVDVDGIFALTESPPKP